MLTGEDTRQTVQMVQHLACTCGCTIQPSDCTQLQDYVAEDCKCTCKRREVCSPDKIWDSSKCKCTCIQQEGECTTGLFYSTSSCRCERAFKRLERKSTSRPPYNSNRNPDSYWKSRREELEQQDIN
ncbi:balbiani ring protein 3 [Eurytemora carolleeae]|uniref:balbiani ring protein 3 n=1 Tax=Eurytemora carolleeae TaxID=1294199 RepID=UPI000C761B02|nr:balbiani ring protein 3 [Eurytemora carolleeae]|eukprot:XP_023333799.1 balbiani ring protein 3-like [Eurytemora affinis]